MDKPFQVTDLVEKLKAKGLPVVEEMAKDIEESVIEWIEESVKMTPSPLDDLAIPVIMALKPLIDAQIDKIDGK